MTIVQARRIGRLRRRLDGLTRGTDGPQLERVLGDPSRQGLCRRPRGRCAVRSVGPARAAGRRAIQRVGLVRFNPFEDTGGNQSFALALPDAAGDGFIVSSLHSRTGTRVYAKAIADGRSDGALSEEESEALRRALTGSGGASPTDAGPAIGSPDRPDRLGDTGRRR